MRKLITLAMVLGLLVSGCATSRVWQSRDTKEPSSNEEVAIAIKNCESTEIVTNAHKTVHTWRVVAWSTICLWPVGIIGIIGEQSAQKDYVGALVNCMREANFDYFEYTKGINWDYHSGSDMSKSEWLDYQTPKPKNLEPSKSTSNQPRRGTDTGWEGQKEYELHKEIRFVSSSSPQAIYYHLPSCSKKEELGYRGAAIYLTRDQAEKKGLKPCPICKP